MKNLKINVIIWGLSMAVITLSVLYIHFHRSLIFDYSVNKLIESLLPANVEIKRLNFDFENKRIAVKDLRIANPKGFRRTAFIRIPEININYSQRDKRSILKGVVISSIVLTNPVLYLERSKDGSTNIQHLIKAPDRPEKSRRLPLKTKLLAVSVYLFSPAKKTYNLDEIKSTLEKIIRNTGEMIEVTPLWNIKNGSLIFDDRYTHYKGHKTTVENIEAKIDLQLKKDLRGLDYIKSEGSGFVNGQKEQTLHWIVASDPKTPKLTMSNKLTVQNVNLVHFKPYYDRFSPFIFENATASGKLIFNLNNGNIDSLNELWLTTPELKIKTTFPFKDLWAVGSQELYKYFSSQSGEIFFDFEIKGLTQQPQFSLGPKTKIAVAKMVIDKIVDVLLEKTDESQTGPGSEKGFIQKIIDKYKQAKEPDPTQPQDETPSSSEKEKSGL